MAEKKQAEIEISGAVITGKVDTAKSVVVGSANTQTDVSDGSVAQQGNVIADKITGRDDLRNYEDHRSGNITFQNPDNAVLLQAIFAVKDQVSGIDKSTEVTNKKVADIDFKMDDMPARLRTLELRVPWATWILLAVIIGTSVLIAVFFAGRLSM